MIHPELRKAVERVHYKRVVRLIRLESLHIRRRRRKIIPVTDCAPLICTWLPNQIRSMDLVFDQLASGQTIKCLAVLTAATDGAITLVIEHSIGGNHLVQIYDGIGSRGGGSKIVRPNNGP